MVLSERKSAETFWSVCLVALVRFKFVMTIETSYLKFCCLNELMLILMIQAQWIMTKFTNKFFLNSKTILFISIEVILFFFLL